MLIAFVKASFKNHKPFLFIVSIISISKGLIQFSKACN